MLQPPALEKFFKFPLHIARQFLSLLCHKRSECRVILVNDLIEKGLLGSVALVTTSIPIPAGRPGRHMRHVPRPCNTVFTWLFIYFSGLDAISSPPKWNRMAVLKRSLLRYPLAHTRRFRILPFSASARAFDTFSRIALRIPQSFSSTCSATVMMGRMPDALAKPIHSCQAPRAPRTRLPFQIFRAF